MQVLRWDKRLECAIDWCAKKISALLDIAFRPSILALLTIVACLAFSVAMKKQVERNAIDHSSNALCYQGNLLETIIAQKFSVLQSIALGMPEDLKNVPDSQATLDYLHAFQLNNFIRNIFKFIHLSLIIFGLSFCCIFCAFRLIPQRN